MNENSTGDNARAAAYARLGAEIDGAQAIVVGAGAGLSAAAGLTYAGARFRRYFSDFAARYGFHDMYAGAFYPFPSPEEFWAYWARHIYWNRYASPVGRVYRDLRALLQGKNYFVLTTNVDHQFLRAGFEPRRLFATQGDYGLCQCPLPCHHDTYDNERAVRAMFAAQADCRVPPELIPRCPRCGRPMRPNLRVDERFVEDRDWQNACARYAAFLRASAGARTLFLELGVGMNTPGIIKFPFWRMTAERADARYVCVNLDDAFAPGEIAARALCIEGDLGEVLARVRAPAGRDATGAP